MSPTLAVSGPGNQAGSGKLGGLLQVDHLRDPGNDEFPGVVCLAFDLVGDVEDVRGVQIAHQCQGARGQLADAKPLPRCRVIV